MTQKSHQIQILWFCLSDTLYYKAAALSGCVPMLLMNTRHRPLIAGRNSLSVLFGENQLRNCSHCLCPQRWTWSGFADAERISNEGGTLWSFAVCSHMVFIFSFAGDLRSTTVQHRPTAKQKHYGTTVPLQLVGQDWKPVSQLKPQVKNSGW